MNTPDQTMTQVITLPVDSLIAVEPMIAATRCWWVCQICNEDGLENSPGLARDKGVEHLKSAHDAFAESMVKFDE